MEFICLIRAVKPESRNEKERWKRSEERRRKMPIFLREQEGHLCVLHLVLKKTVKPYRTELFIPEVVSYIE